MKVGFLSGFYMSLDFILASTANKILICCSWNAHETSLACLYQDHTLEFERQL